MNKITFFKKPQERHANGKFEAATCSIFIGKMHLNNHVFGSVNAVEI